MRIDLIQIRRGTSAEAALNNPVLEVGEMGYETDTLKHKFGDGSTAWNALPYAGGGDSDGNTTYINRANTTENVEPTSGEVPNPINGDTAEINLDDTIIEKWIYSSDAWVKRFSFNVVAGSTPSWQEVLTVNAIVTTVPVMEGGATIGADNGFPAILTFKGGVGGGAGQSIVVSTTSGASWTSAVDFGFSVPELSLNANNISSTNKDGWNAATNTPTLADSDSFANGLGYIVTVAGTHDFGSGNITFGIGDIVSKLDDVWFKKVNNNQSATPSTETALYNATTTGTVTLDCSTFDSWYRILTGNTDFQFSNTPASGESFVKTLEVVSTAGESLTFTTADKVIGTFNNDNTTVNLININFANYPTLGLRVTVAISQ